MSATSITPFAFGENLVRIHMDENGNPWFVPKDVCQILGIQNPSDTVSKVLDEDEKAAIDSIYTSSNGVEQVRSVLIISESGLYSLVFRSRKSEAKAFSRWVRKDVLPAIRKTGSYAMPGAKIGRRIALPADLPPEALALRPAMRQRLWRDALDTARLDNSGLDVAHEWFGKLCCLVAAMPPEPDSAAEKVRAFFAQCCVSAHGHVVLARVLYEAMRRWHKGQSEDMPSMRSFGEEMGRLAPRVRSNGTLYRDITLKNA